MKSLNLGTSMQRPKLARTILIARASLGIPHDVCYDFAEIPAIDQIRFLLAERLPAASFAKPRSTRHCLVKATLRLALRLYVIAVGDQSELAFGHDAASA
jgi:hypothetical protein